MAGWLYLSIYFVPGFGIVARKSRRVAFSDNTFAMLNHLDRNNKSWNYSIKDRGMAKNIHRKYKPSRWFQSIFSFGYRWVYNKGRSHGLLINDISKSRYRYRYRKMVHNNEYNIEHNFFVLYEHYLFSSMEKIPVIVGQQLPLGLDMPWRESLHRG